MKKMLKRFGIPMDDASIDERIRVEPPPLLDLGSLPAETACIRLEKILKVVFIPTQQVFALLRYLFAIAKEHVLMAYPNEATYSDNCHVRDLTSEDPGFPIGLTGLSGVGKSALLRALGRLLADTGETIALPGLPEYPIQTIWMMTMRSGGSLGKLLRPILDPNGLNKDMRDENLLKAFAAKRAYSCGVALMPVDEFQFITSTPEAHATAAKTLMELTYIGPPPVYCANYSMINKLQKRPQQERQRLLANVKILYPDPSYSDAWINSLTGQINVAPDIFASDFAIDSKRDAEAVHRYSFGLKRLSARLLTIGYCRARESGRNVVRLTDIEWAYKSPEFADSRKDVEMLVKQSIENRPAHDDLWCDMAMNSSSNVILATPAIQAHKARVTEALVVSSMNREEREDYESVMGKIKPTNTKRAGVVPIRRNKLTMEQLLENNKSFRDKFDPPGKG